MCDPNFDQLTFGHMPEGSKPLSSLGSFTLVLSRLKSEMWGIDGDRTVSRPGILHDSEKQFRTYQDPESFSAGDSA